MRSLLAFYIRSMSAKTTVGGVRLSGRRTDSAPRLGRRGGFYERAADLAEIGKTSAGKKKV